MIGASNTKTPLGDADAIAVSVSGEFSESVDDVISETGELSGARSILKVGPEFFPQLERKSTLRM